MSPSDLGPDDELASAATDSRSASDARLLDALAVMLDGVRKSAAQVTPQLAVTSDALLRFADALKDARVGLRALADQLRDPGETP